MKIVDGKPYIDQIKGLIEEYTKRLGRDLTFQNLEEELADPAKNIPRRKASCWRLWRVKRSLAWWRITDIPPTAAR